MILNDIQFVHSFALIEGLRIMAEKAIEKRRIHPLDDKTKVKNAEGKTVTRRSLAVKGLQDFVVGKGNNYAVQLDWSNRCQS